MFSILRQAGREGRSEWLGSPHPPPLIYIANNAITTIEASNDRPEIPLHPHTQTHMNCHYLCSAHFSPTVCLLHLGRMLMTVNIDEEGRRVSVLVSLTCKHFTFLLHYYQ